ncbi:class I SAM-dependent methyltransferase [Mesorhizobium sp. SP-1A]|uniref:class I SAM-dependent methyltransferase n=1 Tax=Mesorhizobium sp. SP-1A TaxID=3077840 RepID=UPI0028F6D33B|nr:class I SAM-dependent methyltransferase [Mesorhizobium sp. SP-1A]
MEPDRADHWNGAYADKGEQGVSWFEQRPESSIELIEELAGDAKVSVIDIGGGASRLVDAGLARGWSMAVLDISRKALDIARKRLGKQAEKVEWITADVTQWRPGRSYDVWHDRAAFHFLTEAEDRAAYIANMRAALKPGGHAIIATFAADGPQRCSGLPVRRYDPAELAETVGAGFRPVAAHKKVHTTPWGSTQAFQFSLFERVAP